MQTIGFAPGQPYLGELPEAWDIPRQTALTDRVPIGALTVAIRQLVLFSVSTPTGWRHIGQTAFRPFRPDAETPFVLRPGDEVIFEATDRECYERLRGMARWRGRVRGDPMSRLIVQDAGPGVSVQDLGRPGYLAFGLSRGGAADRLAMAEGAALLHQSEGLAALEMAGMGGIFEVSHDTRIALTGAPMRASVDGAPLAWNASHLLHAGSRLSIGAATRGVYGYLHLGGGIATPERLGARSAHLAAGLGALIAAGDALPLGEDRTGAETGLCLPTDDRFEGGAVRVVPAFRPGFSPKRNAPASRPRSSPAPRAATGWACASIPTARALPARPGCRCCPR